MGFSWYKAGLLEQKARLQKELRLQMARYARMEKMDHPDTKYQGMGIELTQKMIRLVESEITARSTHGGR